MMLEVRFYQSANLA